MAGVPGGGATEYTDDVSLLRRFEPVLRFTEGEFFLPAPKGSLTIDELVEFGADHPRPGHYLRLVDTPFTRIEVAKWGVRGDRRRWDDPDLTIEGEHPVIFAGLGSHSGAHLAGEYLTTHDIPAFAGLLGLTTSDLARLLPVDSRRRTLRSVDPVHRRRPR